MAPKLRLLTKSRFKIGCECPTKLYFTGKPEYGNNKVDNPFLEALAEGGFQVGELAKLYHEGGTEVTTLNVAAAIETTSELLKSDSAILYEPAIRFGNLLVRVDVLVKNGNSVELIEVKAKSFDPTVENPFYNKLALKKGAKQINGEWQPYLFDIAFQTYVVRKAFPKWKVSSFLMLADKTATASVDGINQHFFLARDAGGQVSVETTKGLRRDDLGSPLLVKVDVGEEVDVVLSGKVGERSFEEHVSFLADAYIQDQMASPDVGAQCKSCEFRIDPKKRANGLISGFETCWNKAAHLSPDDLLRPMVFEIWNFRKSQTFIENGHYFIADLAKDDIDPKPKDGEPGLSNTERQWLQVEKVQRGDNTAHLDRDGLIAEMGKWRFPLHFIDFETTMVAIPFNKDRRPYEQIAFQFSHHVIQEDGRIEHRTEYLNRDRGNFPNFDFVRHLKKALSNDDGTIFRYAAHENTVLCQIYQQLYRSDETDGDELMNWIESVTTSTDDAAAVGRREWSGSRRMVDLCELVKKYFYHPLTQGSNSIKKVLPAILASSEFLQGRYSNPIYGTAQGVGSKNYKNWQWIRRDATGAVLDPYKLLPPIFSDLDLEEMDSLITDGSIADGGAAMTAYARMQFTQMTDLERDRVSAALLKYCELDTFAMVLIYEYWRDEIRRKTTRRAA